MQRANRIAEVVPPDSSHSLQQAKAALRQQVRRALAAMDAHTREAQGRAVCDRIRHSREWTQARCVGLFAPLPDEPDLRPLWQEALVGGKTLVLPRWDSNTGTYVAARIQDPAADLVAGRYGVLEPRPELPIVAWESLDWLAVPGVAFDRRGGRLGRGAGHYDRILAATPAFRCGVAFACQLVEAVPVAEHDLRVDAVVTPSEWIRCFAATAPRR
jgi:5-formyltetrahydrofolate cyclo-ligase